MIDIRELLEFHDGEFLEFERIENPPTLRPDLCAMLKLHELVLGGCNIISHSEHDEIFFGVSIEDLEKVATEDDIIYLARCGVRYTDSDCLGMFTLLTIKLR